MGVLQLLAERVGADGRVVGLDREARIVEFGRQLAEQRGLAAEFIEADATATGLPDRAFDLVHARTLLLNVQNPEQILNEMVRIAKPCGVVAVQEPDASAWGCDPPHPAFDILRDAILSAYRRTGKDFSIGRRIARMLKDAGLDDVHVRPTARVTHAGEYYQTFLLTVAGLVRDVIVQAGQLTADEFESYTAALRAHLEGARHDHLSASDVAGVGPSYHGDRYRVNREPPSWPLVDLGARENLLPRQHVYISKAPASSQLRAGSRRRSVPRPTESGNGDPGRCRSSPRHCCLGIELGCVGCAMTAVTRTLPGAAGDRGRGVGVYGLDSGLEVRDA